MSFPENDDVDYEKVKERTVIALDRLGHQKFIDEPGSYSLENWMKGINFLLDEFEEKMGAERLTPEYLESRRELAERLSLPVDVASLEKSIAELRQKEAEITLRHAEARAEAASKMDELQRELAKAVVELEEEKRSLSSATKAENNRPFLKRMFGDDSTQAIEISTKKVEELESRLHSLHDEIVGQQRSLESIDRYSGSPWAQEMSELESIRSELRQWEDERLAKVQRAKEREEATASVASAILAISAGESASNGEPASSD